MRSVAVLGEVPLDLALPARSAIGSPLDRELREWKKARLKNYRIPWRQLSLMATLCFGIASLALPDWVNDEVQWVLYALMAASLYTSFAMRRRKAVS